MSRPWRLALGIGLAVALLGWAAFVFWTFSYSFSSSFFRYNQPARFAPFLAAWLGAMVFPVSAVHQWLRVLRAATSRLRAWLTHVAVSALALLPLVAVASVLRVLPAPWKPPADDAMGIGIDFLLLQAMGLGWVVLLTLALLLHRYWKARRRDHGTPP